MSTSSFDIGDVVTLHFEVAVDGTPTDATVALTITLPDGTTSSPTPTNPAVGTYEADYAPAANGEYRYRWTATGAAVAAESGTFDVGTDYTSLDIVKASLGITDTADDTALLRAIRGASRRIDVLTGTTFYPVTQSRYFDPASCNDVWVDRFRTTAGLVVAVGIDGVNYPTTIASAYVSPWPINAVAQGDAYRRLVVSSGELPVGYYYPSVKVTATWGWDAPPAPVVDACTLMAARSFRRKDSPEGIAGSSEFGVVRVSQFDDPDAMLALSPYRDRSWV